MIGVHAKKDGRRMVVLGYGGRHLILGMKRLTWHQLWIKCRESRESGIRTRAIPPPWKPSEALTSAILRSVNSTQNGAKLLGSNCSGVLWIRIAVEEDMKVCGILLFGFVGATATTLAVSSFPLSLWMWIQSAIVWRQMNCVWIWQVFQLRRTVDWVYTL